MQRFLEALERAFPGLSRSEILAILGIIVVIALFLLPHLFRLIRWIKRSIARYQKHSRSIEGKVRHHYEVEFRPLRKRRRDLRVDKCYFYEGRLQRGILYYIAANLHVRRRVFSEILEEIYKSSQRFLHVEVTGSRRQGKSTLLADLAMHLSQSRENIVLWHKELEIQNAALDWGLLNAYRKKRASRWKQRIFRRKGPLRFVIVIDDFIDPSEERLPLKREYFLRQLSEASLSKPSILLITSSPTPVGDASALQYDLALTPSDEESIVKKLGKEEPRLIPADLTLEKIRGSTGGERLYGSEFVAFLALLVHEAEKYGGTDLTAGVRELDLQLSDSSKNMLKYIAVCQLVDVEVLPSVLSRINPDVSVDRLMEESSGWIRRQSLSYSSRGSGLSLGAPHLAATLLRSLGIQSSEDLECLFADILQVVMHDCAQHLSNEESEFVRHILYRLGKGRHFRFLDAHAIALAGTVLARSLFARFRDQLHMHIDGLSDARSLCLWAETLARFGQTELVRDVCMRIVACYPEEGQMDEQSFVTFARALSVLSDVELREAGLKILDLPQLLRQADLSRYRITLRLNQAIHAYCDLLKSLGRFREALDILEEASGVVEPDALTTLLRAELLAMIGDAEAASLYKSAIDRARESIRRSPGLLIKCLQNYGEYLAQQERSKHPIEKLEEYYREAAECREYAPEKEPELLCSWAHSIARIFPRRAFSNYQRSMQMSKKSQTIYVNSNLGCAALLVNRGGEFFGGVDEAYAEAEFLCRQVVNHPFPNWPQKARAYRYLGEQLVGKRPYVSKEGKRRPDFTEALLLLSQAFESNPEERDDPQKKTLADALAHRSLGRFYQNWALSDPGSPEEAARISKADCHFEQAYAGLPRKNLGGLNVRYHVLGSRFDHARFKAKTAREALLDYRELLSLLNSWGLGPSWSATWRFLSDCTRILCEVEPDRFRRRFSHFYSAMSNIAMMMEAGATPELLTRVASHLQGHSISLAKAGKTEAPLYVDTALTVACDYLRKEPSDSRVGQYLSRLIIGRDLHQMEGNERRLEMGLESLQEALTISPSNDGAMEALLRLGDILQLNDPKLSEIHNWLQELLERNDAGHTALEVALARLRTQEYRFKERFSARYLRNNKLMNSRNNVTRF